jgi:hypothetical protein
MSFAMDPRKPTAAARTHLSKDRGEIAIALLEHGLDGEQVTELLDYAGLHGDAQVERARVAFDGESWTVDLFGQRKEAA